MMDVFINNELNWRIRGEKKSWSRWLASSMKSALYTLNEQLLYNVQ